MTQIDPRHTPSKRYSYLIMSDDSLSGNYEASVLYQILADREYNVWNVLDKSIQQSELTEEERKSLKMYTVLVLRPQSNMVMIKITENSFNEDFELVDEFVAWGGAYGIHDKRVKNLELQNPRPFLENLWGLYERQVRIQDYVHWYISK